MKPAVAALAGVVFALGLVVGGMTSPARVVAFLDVAGAWDPTLAFVMAGAIAVYAPVARNMRGRSNITWPSERAIDVRLVGGAVLFGIGWGLSGYCPGPALVSLGASIDVGVFVVAMLAGIALVRAAQRGTV